MKYGSIETGDYLITLEAEILAHKRFSHYFVRFPGELANFISVTWVFLHYIIYN